MSKDPQCAKCPHPQSKHTFKSTTECCNCQCQAFVEPVVPREVAETLSYITGLSFVVPEEGLGALEYPQTIFPAADGPKMIRKNKLFASVVPLTDAHGAMKLKDGVYPLVPKLPWSILEQTVAFFRYINKTYDEAEVMVQVFRDPKVDDPQEGWVMFVPPQTVSKGGITHTGHFDAEGSMLHVADIHSHNTMSAFWSGTDDADERRAERFYGVLGEIDKPLPQWKWRVRSGSNFIDIPIQTLFQVPATRTNFDIKLTELLGAEIQGGRAKLFLTIDPFEKATFPDEWTKQVTVRQFAASGGGWYGQMGFHQDDNAWGESASGSTNANGTSMGGRSRLIDLDEPDYMSKPREQWTEDDRLEFDADLELAARQQTRAMRRQNEPMLTIIDTSRGWYPAGDPFPSVYDGKTKITYVVGEGGRITRRTNSGLNILTTLSIYQVFTTVIPRVGKDLVEVYAADGKPYVWRA